MKQIRSDTELYYAALQQYHWAFGLDCRGGGITCSVCQSYHPLYGEAFNNHHAIRLPVTPEEFVNINYERVFWHYKEGEALPQGMAKLVAEGLFLDPARHVYEKPQGEGDCHVRLYALLEAPPLLHAADVKAWQLQHDLVSLHAEDFEFFPHREPCYAYDGMGEACENHMYLKSYTRIEEIFEKLRYKH